MRQAKDAARRRGTLTPWHSDPVAPSPGQLPTPWVVAALTDALPRTLLEVARQVWHDHEAAITGTGDLLYTWQLDLAATLTSLQVEGVVAVDAEDRWRLAGAAPTARPGAWTQEELTVAVAAYVALLRAEHAGEPLRRSEVVDDVLARTGRTPAQLDALMANISAVVQEHGFVPLAAYPPRSNVPVGVRPAVAAALGV